MPKRMQTLSPIGEVITAERKALGIRVVDFCREAHISRVTYYSLLKGNNTPLRYTAGSCIWRISMRPPHPMQRVATRRVYMTMCSFIGFS